MSKQEALKAFELLGLKIKSAEQEFRDGNRMSTILLLESVRDMAARLVEYTESKPWVPGSSSRLGAWPDG